MGGMTINNLVHGFTSGAFATPSGQVQLARVEASLGASEELRGATLHQMVREYLSASADRKSELAPIIVSTIRNESPRLGRISLFSDTAEVTAALREALDEERRAYQTRGEFIEEKLKTIGMTEDPKQIYAAINGLLLWIEEKAHDPTKSEKSRAAWELDANQVFDWVRQNRKRIGEDTYNHTLYKVANIHGYRVLNINRALIPDVIRRDPLFIDRGVILFLFGKNPSSMTLASTRDFVPDTKWKFVLVRTELGLLEMRIFDPHYPHLSLVLDRQGIASGDTTFHRSPDRFELIVQSFSEGQDFAQLFEFVAALLQNFYPGVKVENTRTLLGIP